MGHPPIRERERLQVREGKAVPGVDLLAQEEPLEIRIASESIALTMRTPGEDARLAIGFLFSEGILRDIDDVGAVAHCGRPGEDGYGNIVEVTPAPGARLNWERLEAARRGTLTTAACGLCGRRSVEDLVAMAGRPPEQLSLPLSALLASTATLREKQPLFAATGATHGAMALDPSGELLAVHEDIGRHNAVDKVIGALVQERRVVAPPMRGGPLLPAARTPPACALVVSGRASFEIVHKAAMAGIPVVASVSAASALAIELADRLGMALATFVRDGGCNLYGRVTRLAGWSPR